jgi:hypothetical protein
MEKYREEMRKKGGNTGTRKGIKVESLASHTPAHNSTATVAPFRAWRSLQIVIAKEPTKLSITALTPNLSVPIHKKIST